MATTLSPTSSHSMNSSRHSSNRSAATRGSQYLLGRLARTESARASTSSGTKGEVISVWNQASIVSLALGCLLVEERAHRIGEDLRPLDLRMVPRFRNQLKPRAGDEAAVGLTVRRPDDAVRGAPHHERRLSD